MSIKVRVVLLFLLLSSQLDYAQLSGTYTIDPSKAASGSNYKDFTNATSDLIKGSRTDGGTANGPGVKSAVVFNVANGTYREQVEIDAITGASSTNTITFQSASNDSSKVNIVWKAGTSAGNNYAVYLNGAKHIILKKLGISRDSFGYFGTITYYYGTVIELANGADSNQLINNRVTGIKTIFYTVFAFSDQFDIFMHDGARNNIIKGNNILFGCSGIHCMRRVGNNQIENNTCNLQLQYCIYAAGFKNIFIHHNTLENTQYNLGNAISISSDTGYVEITGNKIIMDAGTSVTIYSTADSVMIANNFITLRGIVNSAIEVYGKKVNIFNNNIFSDPDYYLNYNVLIYGGPPVISIILWPLGTGIHFKNNNVVNTGGLPYSSLIYYKGFQESDYNNFYMKGFDLAAWQKSSKMDTHSISLDPGYISDSDLHVTNPLLKKKGIRLPGITTDFDGDIRKQPRSDIGADEFPAFANDAELISIDSPGAGFCGSNSAIIAKVRNRGIDTLKNVKVHYSLNGGSVNDYSWSGNIAPDGSAEINVGSSSFSSGTLYKILAHVSYPNGVTDSNPDNDTIHLNHNSALSGSYTIDTAKGDFKSFSVAANVLHERGVCGPVVIKVSDGTYKEQASFRNISGSSPVNTITIQSASGDSSKVVLDWPADDIFNHFQTGNYVLGLDNVQWLTVKQISMTRSGEGYWGKVVRLYNSPNNSFLNNRIIGIHIHFPASYKDQDRDQVAFYAGEGLDTNLLVKNNYIAYGNYNCYFGNNADTISSVVLQGNTLDSGYSDGVFFNNVKWSSIIGNTIQNIGPYSYYSITIENCSDLNEISGNRIYNRNGGFGIWMRNLNQKRDSLLIYNNIFTMSGLPLTHFYNYPIGMNSFLKVICCYNSFYINNPPNAEGTAFGIYYGNILGGKGCHVFNNCVYSHQFSIAFSGSYSKTDYKNPDYNNLYARLNSLIATYDTQFVLTNLPKWQTYGNDLHSVSVDPRYNDDTTLAPRSIFINDKALPFARIKTDINGNPRGKNPDIGAVEFNPPANDIFVASIIFPQEGDKGDSNMLIKAVIGNNGLDSQSNFSIQATMNGRTTKSFRFKYTKYLRTASFDTVALSPAYNAWYGDTFALTVYTDLANDSDRTNDTLISGQIHLIGHAHKPLAKDIWGCRTPFNANFSAAAQDSSEANYWYPDAVSSKPIFSGDNFTVNNLKNDTLFFVRTAMQKAKDTLAAYKATSDGSDIRGYAAGMYFDALQDFSLDSVTIYPYLSGRVVINVYDPLGNRLSKRVMNVNVKKQGVPIRIPVRVFCPKGTGYYITSDSSNTGGLGYIYNVKFPRTDKLKLVSITGPYATLPGYLATYIKFNFFMNFFNWEIVPGRITYPSEEVKVSARTDTVKTRLYISDSVGCIGSPIVFKDSSSARKGLLFNSMAVNFGDGSTFKVSAGTTFNHTYSKSGSYSIDYLITSSSGCKDSLQNRITINTVPNPSFRFTQINVPGRKVKLAPSDSLIPAKYFWDFGDGTTDTLKNPVHTFPANKKYIVTLKMVNASGCDSIYIDSISFVLTEVITLNSYPLNAEFFPNPFRDNGNISLSLPQANHILIMLYDMQGREIAKIKDIFLQSGNYSFTINSKTCNLNPGIYQLMIIFDNQVINKRVEMIE